MSSIIGFSYFTPYLPPLFLAAIVYCFSCNSISPLLSILYIYRGPNII